MENMVISKETGKCVPCGDFRYPGPDFKVCIDDGPCNEKSIMKVNGRCEECPAGKRPDNTGRNCKKDTCDLLTQINDDLGYCITCGPFTKPNADNTECVSD